MKQSENKTVEEVFLNEFKIACEPADYYHNKTLVISQSQCLEIAISYANQRTAVFIQTIENRVKELEPDMESTDGIKAISAFTRINELNNLLKILQ